MTASSIKALKRMVCFAAVVIASVALIPAQSTAANYKLDDQHTSVVFAVDHFGLSFCYGMFGRYKGDFTVDMDNPSASKFAFVIDAGSLDTKVEKRDEHLRGPDFFDVKQFPEIKFVSKSVTKEGKTLKVTGDMTMHGVTKSIVLPLVFIGEGKGPAGKDRIGFAAKTTLKRSDFGMTTYVPKLGDDVTLMLSFEGIKQ
ncbi:MAG: YceI family protein [Planctomycetota bacterium]